MLGKSQLTISGTQFAAGLCTSDFLGDGGMGLLSNNLNPVYQPGVVYSLGQLSANGLSAHLVASCEEFQATPSENRWAVDTSSNFYYISPSEIISTGISGIKGYLAGISDMAVFDDVIGSHAPGIYITSATDITRLSGTIGGGLSVGAEAFWTSTKSKTALTTGIPHPLLVYQNQLWIGNGNHLPNMNTSGTANNDASWVLDINEEITALGIDPGTGLMMLGVRTVASSGTSASFPAKYFIYLYDGYSAQSRRKIPVQGAVFSFTTVGGQIMVGIDNSIGLWNGNGVSFVRRLSSTGSTPYKQRCAAVNNHFFVADGLQVLGYGDIQNGKKAWYPFYKNNASGSALDIVFQQSVGTIGTTYDGSTIKFLQLFDTGNGAGSGMFYTNNINFERPVSIKGIRVFTTGITTTAGIGGVALIDENGTTHTPTVSKFVVASGTTYRFDFIFGGQKLQTMQPVLTLDTQAFGIVRIIIYYDAAE